MPVRKFGASPNHNSSKSTPKAPTSQPAGPASQGFAETLRLGSKGPSVESLQAQLTSLGFDTQGVDGDFGPNTEAAVRRFQKQNRLEVDGVVGPDTGSALGHGIPRAIVVDEDVEAEEEGGGLGGFLGRLFGGGRDRETSGSSDQQRQGGDQRKGGSDRKIKSNGKGISLPQAGFTVPTSQFFASGMSDEALRTALTAFDTAWGREQTTSTIFTLTDFTKSDDEKRLWVVDLRSGKILHHEFVSHGYGSDGEGYNNNATQFGNRSGSGQSSLGLMRAGRKRESYGAGREGTAAMEVSGLEQGINSNVRSRSVIMHAAQNSNGAYIDERGVHGASAGCWALDPKVNAQVIGSIPAGSLMYNYFPDRRFLESSDYLKKQLQS